MTLEQAASQLETLGSPARLNIHRILVRGGDEGLPVGSIHERLGVPASTLSHHCKRLIETGLASQERQASTLICCAEYPSMQALIGYLADECRTGGRCPPDQVRRKTRERAERSLF